MSTDSLIYIAAFWEAEGHLYIYHRKQNRNGHQQEFIQFEVGISQKNPTILYWIKEEIGFGRLKLNRNSGTYAFFVSNKQARNFLKAIFPFIKFRHKQIIDAWKYWRDVRREIRKKHLASHRTKKFRDIMSLKMKELRRKKYWSSHEYR